MKKILFLHPFLFAIYPTLFLYNVNKTTAPFSYIFFPIMCSLFLAVAITIISKYILKNWEKTSIASSIFIFFFFFSGYYIDYVFFNPLIMLVLILVLYLALFLFIYSTKKDLKILNTYIAIVSVIFVVMPIFSISASSIKKINFSKDKEEKNIEIINDGGDYPDVYYIILDGYARGDILEKYYDYKNNDLIDYLKNKGFYIAENSTTNYPQTYLSLSSSLNYEYINYMSEEVGKKSFDKKPLRKKIIENKVYEYFKKYGYKFVAFFSEYSATEKNYAADIYVDYNEKLNYFDFAVINTTPLKLLFGNKYRFDDHRNKIKFALEKLPEIASIEDPTFTFVHLYAPHPPFVFGQNGEEKNPTNRNPFWDFTSSYPNAEEYRKEYKDQLIFVNKMIEKMIGELLEKSPKQPIIILQGDHGPSSMYFLNDLDRSNLAERYSIFNTYLVPEEYRKDLYSSITPVNSFRFLFNHLFNTNLELLEDKNYFAPWAFPYQIQDITNRIKNLE